MLANYTVFLTVERSVHEDKRSGVSEYDMVLTGPQADVRDVVVDRDVGESIVCRRRYCILPDFRAGYRPYVVRRWGF